MLPSRKVDLYEHPQNLTHEDAARELLKNATLAALKVRKEPRFHLDEKISRLWKGIFGVLWSFAASKMPNKKMDTPRNNSHVYIYY